MDIMKILKTNKLLGLLGLIILFVGVIGPFFVVSLFGFSTSTALVNHWEGIVIIILIVASLLFMYKEKVVELVPSLKNNPFVKKVMTQKYKVLLVFAIIIAALVIIELISDSNSLSLVHFGWGFYLYWIGVLLFGVHTFFYNPDETSKSKK